MFNRARWHNLHLGVWLALSATGSVFAQQPNAKEVYQDFRTSRPLLPAFKLDGPDLDTAVKPEDGGLRITLFATRAENRPVYVAATFPITGDFEITGTYELLAADQPTNGYGVGVSLTVSPHDGVNRFARVARLMRPKTGGRFVSEYLSKDPPKGYKIQGKPAETRYGQLRLVRVGEKLFFLVSDEPGKDFVIIDEQEQFGADDLEYLRFHVTDGNAPGYAVDARFVDLRVRYGSSAGENALKAAPLAPPAPFEAVIAPASSAPIKGRLIATLIIGLVVILLLTMAAGLMVYLRRRQVVSNPK